MHSKSSSFHRSLTFSLGIDTSPLKPTTQPNVHFEADDVTNEWTFGKKFDLIHLRIMYGAVGDFPALYKQCFE